jgi:hypothetical protein
MLSPVDTGPRWQAPTIRGTARRSVERHAGACGWASATCSRSLAVAGDAARRPSNHSHTVLARGLDGVAAVTTYSLSSPDDYLVVIICG